MALASRENINIPLPFEQGLQPFLLCTSALLVPNESTPLHMVADKGTQSAVPAGTNALPVVAITSASMEFISDTAQNDQHTLTVTGSDYRHILQPQTSATPSNISNQTIATDTTAGSEMNLLPTKSNASLDRVCFIDK